MARSLEQSDYELQHGRFLKVLSEALYEIQNDPPVKVAANSTLAPSPKPLDEAWIEVLAGGFLEKCEALKVPYKYQFVAVATLVMALMEAYEKAPLDLANAPVKPGKPS